MLVAATTGLLSVPGSGWNAQDTAKIALGNLPSHFTGKRVTDSLTFWSNDLLNRLHGYYADRDGEIASLLVAFRSDGALHFYRERIISLNHKPQRDDAQSERWNLFDQGAAIAYAGSCRNLISLGGHPAPTPIPPGEKAKLNDWGSYRTVIRNQRGRTTRRGLPCDRGTSSTLDEDIRRSRCRRRRASLPDCAWTRKRGMEADVPSTMFVVTQSDSLSTGSDRGRNNPRDRRDKPRRFRSASTIH